MGGCRGCKRPGRNLSGKRTELGYTVPEGRPGGKYFHFLFEQREAYRASLVLLRYADWEKEKERAYGTNL